MITIIAIITLCIIMAVIKHIIVMTVIRNMMAILIKEISCCEAKEGCALRKGRSSKS